MQHSDYENASPVAFVSYRACLLAMNCTCCIQCLQSMLRGLMTGVMT